MYDWLLVMNLIDFFFFILNKRKDKKESPVFHIGVNPVSLRVPFTQPTRENKVPAAQKPLLETSEERTSLLLWMRCTDICGWVDIFIKLQWWEKENLLCITSDCVHILANYTQAWSTYFMLSLQLLNPSVMYGWQQLSPKKNCNYKKTVLVIIIIII